MPDIVTVPTPVDADKFRERLLSLLTTHHVICMTPFAYAAVRKYGRDILSILSSSNDTPDWFPFYMFGYKAGILAAIYVCKADVEDSLMTPGQALELLRKGDVDWALIVSTNSVPDGFLRISRNLGDPWEDVPLNAPSTNL